MALSEQQKRDFRELGWFHLGPIFDGDELAEISAEYDRILANPLRIGERGKTPFAYSPLLHVQSPVLCRHACSPRLAEAAVELLGPDVRLYWDQAVSKTPGATSDIPWHQDNGYTPVVPEEYVTCTVALDRTTKENGCLWIQTGSHKQGTLPHRPTDMLFFRGYEGPETGEPVEQGRGGVLVFSSLTMHRTGPNLSSEPRRSWVIQFCPAHASNRDTGVQFDDRLLVAKDGVPLAEPYRDRDLDVQAILTAAARKPQRRAES